MYFALFASQLQPFGPFGPLQCYSRPASIILAPLCPSLPTSHPTGWVAQLLVLRKSSVPMGVFIAWSLLSLLNSYRKWQIVGISRVEEEKEHSSPLIISVITVVICRYEINLKLNAVHSSVNPECKSSWGEEPFQQVNLHVHLKCD